MFPYNSQVRAGIEKAATAKIQANSVIGILNSNDQETKNLMCKYRTKDPIRK